MIIKARTQFGFDAVKPNVNFAWWKQGLEVENFIARDSRRDRRIGKGYRLEMPVLLQIEGSHPGGLLMSFRARPWFLKVWYLRGCNII